MIKESISGAHSSGKLKKNHILYHVHQHSLCSGLFSPPLSSLCRRCLSPESPSPRSGVSGCVCAGASSLPSARWQPVPPCLAAACLRCRDCGYSAPGTPRRHGGRWMPRPADNRARSGGWCSLRLCCLLHVCPSSPRTVRTCQEQPWGLDLERCHKKNSVIASESDREVAHIEGYESHKLVRRAIRSIRAVDVFSPLTLSSNTATGERCEPHGPERWAEPPHSSASSHSNFPARHIHLGSFWVFSEGSYLIGSATGDRG